MTRRLAAALVAASMLAPAPRAQTYPSKAVTLVVPFPAGGSTERLSRLLGQKLDQQLKQSFIVENRAGGNRDINTRGPIAIVTPAPAELKSFVHSEIARWGKVVDEAGARGTEPNSCSNSAHLVSHGIVGSTLLQRGGGIQQVNGSATATSVVLRM
jgi:tripartite-type tricarboxylate transporter receptor subunit TctC